jgi:hypothetical protein
MSEKNGSKPPGKPPGRRVVAVPSSSGGGFVTEYRHYRTGKLMRAKDFGYKAWPFGYGRRG